MAVVAVLPVHYEGCTLCGLYREQACRLLLFAAQAQGLALPLSHSPSLLVVTRVNFFQ